MDLSVVCVISTNIDAAYVKFRRRASRGHNVLTWSEAVVVTVGRDARILPIVTDTLSFSLSLSSAVLY